MEGPETMERKKRTVSYQLRVTPHCGVASVVRDPLAQAVSSSYTPSTHSSYLLFNHQERRINNVNGFLQPLDARERCILLSFG